MELIIILGVVGAIGWLIVTRDNREILRAGRKGEKLVFNRITRLVGRRGKVYRNVLLPLYDTTTEIDLLIAVPQGLIIIENKHLKGVIEGHPGHKTWQQRKRRQIKQFYNPIMQNNGHFKCLTHHLRREGLGHVDVYSCVIFSHPESYLNVDDYRIRDMEGGVDFIHHVMKRPAQYQVQALTRFVERCAKTYA